MSHTPGPWTVLPTSSGGLLVVRLEQSLQVFPVADAHLMAAAPDLLTALKSATASLESWIHDQLDGTSSLRGALEELKPYHAAIAKAEGRS